MDFDLQKPTLVPFPNFSATEDARRIKVALKDAHKQSDTIIEIFTARVSSQRLEIITTYKNHFKKDLHQEVKEAYIGRFSKLLRALVISPYEYLAIEVNKAMSGCVCGTDDDVLTEILCTRSNEDILLISQAFRKIFETSIEEELDHQHNVCSDYKELIGMLLRRNRHERHCDIEKARKCAHLIFNTGVNSGKTLDLKSLMNLLTHKSYPQLCLIFEEYRKISKRCIEEVISLEFGGHLKVAMNTIVKCAINRSQYYAEKLESAMRGLHFNDETLIRIITTRSEIDLESIKHEYLKHYHKTLYYQIQCGTGGEYKKALLALLGD